MEFFFTYIVKVAVSLTVVALFYHLVLRKLTFYNWNRWYLLGYTALCFFIPFIDISPVLKENNTPMVQWVPVISQYTSGENNIVAAPSLFTFWNIAGLLLLTGMIIMLLRLCIQVFSFRKMMKKAEAIADDNLNIYQVDDNIIPFSFGNSIFINRHLHTEAELQEIIRHEFVHVKQRHSIDIIWGELLCLFNWYNPFAWLLKKSIRQNLEFIADNKVLENGVNKKEYQYLLLKVIGNNQYSIATQFNFSSLKKRIAMMNKNKSAKMHLLRFLFLLPVLAVILVSFRKEIRDTFTGKDNQMQIYPGLLNPIDTVPAVTEPNTKGYVINIMGNKGDCMVVVKDKNGKEVKKLLLTEWNDNAEKYEALYGEIPPPPPPPVPPLEVPVPPTPPEPMKLPENVKKINITNGKATVWLKDGKKESYDLNVPAEKGKFEDKYGKVVPLVPVTPIAAGSDDRFSKVSDDYEITDKKAVIHLRNGKTEKYDLTKKEDLNAFEKKYGKEVNVNANINYHADVNVVSEVSVNTEGVAALASPVTPVAIKTNVKGVTAIAPLAAVEGVTVVDDYGYTITGKEDVLITITKRTTKEELQSYIAAMKAKGIELSYDDMIFENGKLIKLTGNMISKDGHSNFVAVDFDTLILAIIKNGEKTYFKVSVQDTKKVVI